MAQNVYYPYDFEAHKNLFHKQFPIAVYYFMDGAVYSFAKKSPNITANIFYLYKVRLWRRIFQDSEPQIQSIWYFLNNGFRDC